MTYFWRGKEGTQQTRAETGGADLLLLCLSVMGIFKQLDLVKDERRKALV